MTAADGPAGRPDGAAGRSGRTSQRIAAMGETMTIVSDAGSPVLHVRLDLEAVHHAPPAHVHPGARETFTVVGGSVDVRVGRRWRALTAGESATAVPGAVHAYRNASGHPAALDVTVEPGAEMREFFLDLMRLSADGRLSPKGPSLPDAAWLFGRHPQAVVLPYVPAAVQRVLWQVAGRRRHAPPR